MNPKQAHFLELTENNQGIIHKICLFYTDDTDSYNDLYQEIILQSWISFSSFKGKSKYSTWLYKVALNTAITSLKKTKKDRELQAQYKQQESEPSAQERIIRGEQFEDMRIAISKLNQSEKALIFLYLEEKSYKEIANILGISISLTGVKLNRIKTKLKLLMEDDR